MRLLIFANKFDEDDDLLGFFVSWVAGLSKNFEKISVVTQFAGTYPNFNNVEVFSLKKSQRNSRLARLVAFYRLLWNLRKSYDAAFIFMAPAWLIAAWPVLGILGKKKTLWYAVWKDSFKLRLATILSDKVISSVSRAFPFKTKKLVLAGQGVNINYFKPNETLRDPNRILFLGRIAAIKRIEVLLEALGKIKNSSPAVYDKISIDIVGEPSLEKDSDYSDKLKKLASDLGIGEKLRWIGRVSYRNVLPYYQQAGIFVNLTPTGSFDKTMLEAMACGDILIASNKALVEFFSEPLQKSLLFKQDNSDDLAKKIVGMLSQDNKTKEWRTVLREIVVKNHSQENLVKNLTEIFTSLK